jgi:flagellar export protein FliJ
VKRFEFRLASALKWRELQLQQERETLARTSAAEQNAQSTLDAFHRERDTAREAMRMDAVIDGSELRSLSAYLTGCEPREHVLMRRLAVAQRAVGEQRQRTLEAERRVRLIEKLETRQLAEWTQETDRAMESVAQETWTAVRQHSRANRKASD